MVTLCTLYGEEYGSASPAVLGCAAEALGDSHLVSYLPGVAGCLARRVARAVGGLCGDRCGRRFPMRAVRFLEAPWAPVPPVPPNLSADSGKKSGCKADQTIP